MSKHTPGPWHIFTKAVAEGRQHNFARISYGTNECGDGPEGFVAGVADMTGADLALIAAAPDLLEALKRIMPYANTGAAVRDVYTPEQPEFVAARAAIAKAEGQQ